MFFLDSAVAIIPGGPLTAAVERCEFLKMMCAVAEGATPAAPASPAFSSVLFDPRLACMHGRDTLPRSVGSVYAGLVMFFQGGVLKARAEFTYTTVLGACPTLSLDGKSLLSLLTALTHTLHESDIPTGLRVWMEQRPAHEHTWLQSDIHTGVTGRVWMAQRPSLVALAPNGAIFFAADTAVYEVTPQLVYKSGIARLPGFVHALCASAIDVAAVSAWHIHWLSHGGVLRCAIPYTKRLPATCFLNDDKHLVVLQRPAEFSIFTSDGTCVRRFLSSVNGPIDTIVCSRFGEIVVGCSQHLYVYDAGGELLGKYHQTQLSQSPQSCITGILLCGCGIVMCLPTYSFALYPEEEQPSWNYARLSSEPLIIESAKPKAPSPLLLGDAEMRDILRY